MASAEEKGLIEVKFSDQAESNPVTVISNHSNAISQATKTPSGATFEALLPLGASVTRAKRTIGRVLIFFTSDAADIIESEECALMLPILLSDAAGNVVQKKVLTFDNMTGFTAAGTVDITCAANIPQRVCYWDVPRGLIASLDFSGKFHAYIGDDS